MLGWGMAAYIASFIGFGVWEHHIKNYKFDYRNEEGQRVEIINTGTHSPREMVIEGDRFSINCRDYHGQLVDKAVFRKIRKDGELEYLTLTDYPNIERTYKKAINSKEYKNELFERERSNVVNGIMLALSPLGIVPMLMPFILPFIERKEKK